MGVFTITNSQEMPWTLQQKIFTALGIFSIFSLLFFLSRSLYDSYQLDQQILQIQKKNEKIETEMNDLQKQVDYFSSKQYQDKYAKEVLNKVNLGEKVIIFSTEEENIIIPESEFLNKKNTTKTPQEAWRYYFLGDESLETRQN